MEELLKFHLSEPVKVQVSLVNKNGVAEEKRKTEFRVDPQATCLIALHAIVMNKLNLDSAFYLIYNEESKMGNLQTNSERKLQTDWDLQIVFDSHLPLNRPLQLIAKPSTESKDWDVFSLLDFSRVASLASQQTQQAASHLYNKMERMVLKTLNSRNDSISSNLTNQTRTRPALVDSGCSSVCSSDSVFIPSRLPEYSNDSKSISSTAKRLMQLRLVKRQTTINSHNYSQSSENEFASVHNNPHNDLDSNNIKHSQPMLNVYLQALLDRSVEQISDGLGQSATWSQLAPLSQPLSYDQFVQFLDQDGRLRNIKSMQLYVYRHGVQPKARPVVWKHLLSVYRPSANWCERNKLDQQHRAQYEHLKCNWQSKLNDERVQQTYQQIQTDALQTDRNHPFFVSSSHITCKWQHSRKFSCPECLTIATPAMSSNQLSLINVVATFALNNRLGYQPGMLDLCAPLLFALHDESNVYTCFCALMRKLETNFDMTKFCTQLTTLRLLLQHFDPELFAHLAAQQADHLLFTYRWLMLQLKREFPLESIASVFEVLWASTPTVLTQTNLSLFDQPFCNDQANFELLYSYANQSNIESVNFKQTSTSRPLQTSDNNLSETTDAWPIQVRNAMRSLNSLYSNLEQAMRTDSFRGRNASSTGCSSGLGSCSSLASLRAADQILSTDQPISLIFNEELSIEPSIDLCNLLRTQLCISIPLIRSSIKQSTLWQQKSLLDLSILPSTIPYKNQPVKPRRSIRFLPKILSNDSAEMIDSPDADCNAEEQFVFPPKPIDKQTSVDSLDSIELNRSSSDIVTNTRPLGRHSNSFDEQRKNTFGYNSNGSSFGTANNINSKIPASRTHSAGPARRQLNRIPPPLRLNGAVGIRTQRSLPNSPLLKKKQDSFERMVGNGAIKTNNISSTVYQQTTGFRQTSTEDSVTIYSAIQRRAPDRCDSLDPADQLVHCSGDQADDSLSVGISFSDKKLLETSSLASNAVGSGIPSRVDWAPEIGLLDARFDSFDADFAPPSPSDACPGLKAAFGWRSRTSVLATVANVATSSPSNFPTFGNRSMSKNAWKSRRTETQRQPSIGSLSSDSSAHSCDECDQERECTRRRSSTDDLALDSNIVLVCGQGASIPNTHQPTLESPWSPTLQENSDYHALRKSRDLVVSGTKYKSNVKTEQTSNLDSICGVVRSSATINHHFTCPQLHADNAFLLFTCLTILLQHREPILCKQMNSEQIYDHFDRLIRLHNAPQVLNISRQLFHAYLRGRQNIERSSLRNQR